ncbi:MAG TPA: response regulator [Gemmatimonadales bacterium]|nr:response regulator [Gemmatimonadales bacterium]
MARPEAVAAPAPSILLVDDTVENLRLLAGMLATRGFDARPVTSGAEALEAVAHELPDLILLDVTMPGMNGFEVCARLKEQPDSRDIPVIFLTALTDVSDKVKGFAVGGVDYITKPFQLEEVLARVTTQLALRRARRDLEETIQQLREVQRLRDDLTHMIVHDMRSPLTVLVMQLGALRMDLSGELAQSIDEATAGVRQLTELANTLLDVSRLEEGKMPINKAPADLVRIAGDVRTALANMESDRVINLITTGPVMANCDAALVRRVLENLVSNGIKHTQQGGKLTIEVKSLPGKVRVAVQDEGEGVPPEARQRIFEKFGSVVVRKDRTYHSVGLGLAFCSLAVEAHGGTIGVEDATPRGSIFAFELPT